MMSEKTHYRKVAKSDHLGIADLEDFIESGSNLIFTISHVKQEYGTKVAGRSIDANIAYFNDNIKPLVINQTNGATMKKLTGSAFVEDWAGTTIQLYIDPTAKLKGEVVGGVRISPKAPTTVRKKLQHNTVQWERAVAAFQRDGNLDAVTEHVDVSPADIELIKQQASA